ncbi:MAG: nickel-dependent lactate racemase [Microlunatus sp.]|nr:nickel-dependent lactate racemase [Microlunatus sp.]MDN5769862.1 nickel-dependent lactate racemase [Microlunatus sp.]
MARPGFVLDVDDRTPPLLVASGDTYRLERLPIGSRVVYPADSLPPIHPADAIQAALDTPVGSDPLTARLRPGMRLTIAFDDTSSPVPAMTAPDLRAKIIEAVLSRAAAAGIDDVALIAGIGLNRRQTAAELRQLVGERVFRSFHADGLLTNHDAEDLTELADLGEAGGIAVGLNRRAVESDLLVYVHLVTSPAAGGAAVVLSGLGSAATLAALGAHDVEPAARAAAAALVAQKVPLFAVEAVLDADVFPEPMSFLAKREWEWGLKDQARWFGLRRATAVVSSVKLRRRVLGRLTAPRHAIGIAGGDPHTVDATSRQLCLAQQMVTVNGQADVGVIGVSGQTPYSVDAPTNPVLAAWAGLAATYGAHTGTPLVRDGGALIVFHPLGSDFSPLFHPSYVDFFAEVLTDTTEPSQISAEFEKKFATDPWFVHLYRSSHAFHGLHPVHRWYEIAQAIAKLGDVVWVGADRANAERLGFRAASTLADALEIVSSSVGRTPQITYLHTPPQVVVDLS